MAGAASSLGINRVNAIPRAQNVPAPTARALTSPGRVWVGTETPNRIRPIAISTTVITAAVTTDVPIRPQKTIHGGTGVARTRLRTPVSRIRVNPIARATNEAEITARAMNAG